MYHYGKSHAVWDQTALPATRQWWQSRPYPSQIQYSIWRRDARLSWPTCRQAAFSPCTVKPTSVDTAEVDNRLKWNIICLVLFRQNAKYKVSGVLLKIMLSCDNVVYICLCVSLLPVFWWIKVFIKHTDKWVLCLSGCSWWGPSAIHLSGVPVHSRD